MMTSRHRSNPKQLDKNIISQQVLKGIDYQKPKVQYEFDITNNPEKYLALKTNRRKSSIK